MAKKAKKSQILEIYRKKPQKSAIVWENGVPRAVVEHPRFDKQNSASLLTELSKEFLNFPYDGEDDRYFGMTKGEAMVAQLVDSASTGSAESRKELMDRIVGKPMQNIKSMTLKGTLSDYLDALEGDDTDVTDI